MGGAWTRVAGSGSGSVNSAPRGLCCRVLGRLLEPAAAEGYFSAHLPRCLVACQPPCSVAMWLTGSDCFPQVFFFLSLQEVNTHSFGKFAFLKIHFKKATGTHLPPGSLPSPHHRFCALLLSLCQYAAPLSEMLLSLLNFFYSKLLTRSDNHRLGSPA